MKFLCDTDASCDSSYTNYPNSGIVTPVGQTHVPLQSLGRVWVCKQILNRPGFTQEGSEHNPRGEGDAAAAALTEISFIATEPGNKVF